MATFLTEYGKDGCKWSGCEIEAESLEGAIAVANQIAALERQLQQPRFSELAVIGTLEAEIAIQSDQAHAVTQMHCQHCSKDWTAVHPAGLEFLHCPRCDSPCDRGTNRANPVN